MINIPDNMQDDDIERYLIVADIIDRPVQMVGRRSIVVSRGSIEIDIKMNEVIDRRGAEIRFVDIHEVPDLLDFDQGQRRRWIRHFL